MWTLCKLLAASANNLPKLQLEFLHKCYIIFGAGPWFYFEILKNRLWLVLVGSWWGEFTWVMSCVSLCADCLDFLQTSGHSNHFWSNPDQCWWPLNIVCSSRAMTWPIKKGLGSDELKPWCGLQYKIVYKIWYKIAEADRQT